MIDVDRVRSCWAVGGMLIGALGLPASAQAQGMNAVTIQIVDIVSRIDPRKEAGIYYQDWITRSDCLANVPLTFRLAIDGATDLTLEAWVGPASGDCSTLAARDSVRAPGIDCWKVSETVPATNGEMNVAIPAQRIAAEDSGKEGVSACRGGSHFGGFPLAISFLLLQRSTTVSGVKYMNIGTALDGVAPPKQVTVAPAAEKLQLSWDSDSPGLTQGFQFFCEPLHESSSPLQSSYPGADFSGSGDSGGRYPWEYWESAPEESWLPKTNTEIVSSSARGEPCFTWPTLLIPGQRPDPRLACGSAGKEQRTGRTNWLYQRLQYAVGIASVDQFGEVGPLSAITCSSPLPLKSPPEDYRDANLVGDGNSCSFGRHPTRCTWIAITGALLALSLHRRKHRRAQRQDLRIVEVRFD